MEIDFTALQNIETMNAQNAHKDTFANTDDKITRRKHKRANAGKL